MAITIQAVDLHSKQAIEHFLHLPWTIYVRPDGTRDPHWVPPFLLKPRHNYHYVCAELMRLYYRGYELAL